MPHPDAQGIKVLIVDDAATMRSMLRGLLVAEGYAVVGQLSSGSGIMGAISQTRPDIICLDYHMPGIHGIELLSKVHTAHPDIAVVMITGDTEKNLEEDAAEAGAAGFINKPFLPNKVLQDMLQVAQARRLVAAARSTDLADTSTEARAKAVVADDSATMRSLLTTILRVANIQVVAEARDGRQAVEMVRAHQPQIVCLDWNMPGMDGIDALKIIRKEFPKVQALMITSRATREAIIEANQSGAKGYILKPFHPDKVMGAINKLLLTP